MDISMVKIINRYTRFVILFEEENSSILGTIVENKDFVIHPNSY